MKRFPWQNRTANMSGVYSREIHSPGQQSGLTEAALNNGAFHHNRSNFSCTSWENDSV